MVNTENLKELETKIKLLQVISKNLETHLKFLPI